MTQAIADVSAYWDSVAEKALGNGRVRDNWDKRRAILSRLLEYSFEGSSILELGTGLGVTAAGVKLTTARMRYKGTDTSPVFAEYAAKFLHDPVIVAKSDNLPFGDNEFTVLFAFDSLEHIHPGERVASYREMGRVLQERFLVFINNPLSHSSHDDEYDHGFGMSDISEMCEIIGARILELKEYSVGPNNYQFIVLIAQ